MSIFKDVDMPTADRPGAAVPFSDSEPPVTVSRRALLVGAAAGAVALAGGVELGAEPGIEGIPTRVLGRTKRRVTVLGLGTAPIGEGPPDVAKGERIFGEVIDRGVNYVDTARIYGNAEEALARLLPSRRDKLFLVTKVWTDTAQDAERLFSTSLRTLKVDHVDLVHIHNVGDKDLGRVLGTDGVLEYLLKQKEMGKLRHIGISGHQRPGAFVKMLETGAIDVVMAVMNYADRNTYNFEERVLPECRKRNVGVVAMKVYAGIRGGFPNHRRGSVGCVTRPELLADAMAYALDLPGVSVANIGPYTLEQALDNVEKAKRYRRLSPQRREALLEEGRKLAPALGPRYGPVE